MKNNLKTNIVIDLLLFLTTAVVSISGVVIKIIAPLRRVAHEDWVREVAMWIVGESRRMWGKVHLWSGVILLILLVVHIILHWSTIDGFFKKHIKNSCWRNLLYVVLFILLLLSTIPWLWIF